MRLEAALQSMPQLGSIEGAWLRLGAATTEILRVRSEVGPLQH
jgi:hypothetical protein